MDRRSFLRGLLGGAAAVVAPERAYSFLKGNPFAREPLGLEAWLPQGPLLVPPAARILNFADYLKAFYTHDRISELMGRHSSPLLAVIPKGESFG